MAKKKDLSELIKTMNKPTGKKNTSIGEIVIYPFNAGNQTKLYSYTLKDKNTETMAFYYLLSLICFPSSKEDEERPEKPFYDLEKTQLLNKKESFYIIENSGALTAQELELFNNSPSYQSEIVKKINEYIKKSLNSLNKQDINSQLAWLNDTSPLLKSFDDSKYDNLISRGDIEDSKEKRHVDTMKHFADLVKHSKFTFGINAEILQKIEKDSRQNKEDQKTDRTLNYSILAIGVIGVLIAIFK
jgi:hypothetical protein